MSELSANFTPKKFVDFSGLDYFWEKAKAYIDEQHKNQGDQISALSTVVGDDKSGLVKDVKSIQDELDSLSGGAGSIATQISNAITALDLPNTYDAKGSAATAESNAKAYADGLASNYDAAGSAATAESNAKVYADGLASNYDAAGSAAAVAGDLSTHSSDTTVHITADERTAWNAAKTAIDTFLKDADMTTDAVDTLKELQNYMTTDGSAAAELVNRVAALEEIDHEAYIGYVDGKVDGKFDAVGSAATAESNAKAYADGLASNYDAAGSAATAESNAKAYVDGKVDGKFDAIGSAATAKSEAIADAEAKIAALSTVYDAKGSAATAESNAKTYAKTYADALYDSIGSVENTVIDTIFA